MKLLVYLLVILFCPAIVFCQDITGLWKGTMLNDSTQQLLEYEIIITKDKGKYTGYSHTWFLINDKRYYGIKKVRVRIAKDGKIVVQDGDLIENNYPVAPNKHVSQLNVLDFTSHGNDEILEGLFVTNHTKEFSQLTGRVNLKKASQVSQSDLMQYLQKSNGSYLTSVK